MSTPGATLYWRPGCPYCARLRRNLDRAGFRRREVNIWEDQQAAALVRSLARGNETVPTVVVAGRGLVNPSARRVLRAAAATGATGPGGAGEDTGGNGDATVPVPDVTGRWAGAVWSALAAALWVLLALLNPSTTYHLVPAVVVLAWPVSRQFTGGAPPAFGEGVVRTAGGVAVAAVTALALWAGGALTGPTVLHSVSPLVESLLVAAVAGLVGVGLVRRDDRNH